MARLIKEKLKQENFKFCVISSPYYRCLQTSMQICQAIGYENISQKTLFVEDAIEEWYHTCEVPKDVRQKRFWGNNWSEEKNHELFSEINPVYNTIFDYQKYPVLNVKLDEGMDTKCRERFSQVYDTLIEKTSENPDITYICVSHGASIESQQTVMSNYSFPNFCGINLLKSAGKNQKGNSTFKPVIADHYNY